LPTTPRYPVGPRDLVVAEVGAVEVDEPELVGGRRQRGDGDEAERGHERGLARERQAVLETPVRGRELGIDEEDALPAFMPRT
jgi:hypothetical protein